MKGLQVLRVLMSFIWGNRAFLKKKTLPKLDADYESATIYHCG
jgi:hypothetical protein